MNLHYLLMCGGLYMLFGGPESTIHSNHIAKSEHNAGTGEEAPQAAPAGETAPDLGNQPLSATQNNTTLPHDHLRHLISATEDLGRLLVISSGTDFDLGQATLDNHGLLIHTGFRPSMVQITNEAWRALSATRNNLQHLKVRMDKLPEAVKGTLDALVTGQPANVSENLQIMRSCVQDGNEDLEKNLKELWELSEFVIKTSDRLAVKHEELNKASKPQVMTAVCGEDRMSDVLSAITALTQLKGHLVNALELLNKEVGGSMNVTVTKISQSFVETVKEASIFPKAVNSSTIRKALPIQAYALISEAIHLQALAGEYLYVSERCLLSAAGFRLFSTLQHLPKGQAVFKLDQLVKKNKAAWNDTEAFSKRQKEETKQKIDEYKRQIAELLPPPEIGAAGLSGISVLKQLE